VEGSHKKIEKIKALIDSSNIEEPVETLELVLTQVASPKIMRKAKPWFDRECFLKRKEVLHALY
jgi:hypothetical protein